MDTGGNVRFPTPWSTDDRSPDEDRAQISERFDVEDWPVVCEPFTQWALEDNFSCGRPLFEEACRWWRT